MKNYLRLYSRCIPVKGFCRSIIYDFDKNSYDFIPNSLYNLLKENQGLLAINLPLSFKGKERVYIQEYIDFLKEKEFVFPCSKEENKRFPMLDLTWKSYSAITNAIIYLHENIHNLMKIIQDLTSLLCKNLLFIATTFSKEDLTTLSLHTKYQNINSISLYIENHNSIDKDYLVRFIQENKRIKRIILCSFPKEEVIYENKAQLQIIMSVTFSCHICHRRMRTWDSFFPELTLYCESLSYNSCLNRKVAIDYNGFIKNCPNFTEHYGNINDVSLIDVLPRMGKFWDISKNKIEVCRICEYRHMCIDCRFHIKDTSNIYSQPLNCNYNPYIAKWKGEAGFRPIQ